ncbi:DeoR/GlpR family DNA-binding transcription regulator [Oscillospiraceae bacterium MB08-C2-2]|nr:DeoR/GlpR family DNA-binding transcription regulator [Oscillospiraceae bacterium MB08-C2-2]
MELRRRFLVEEKKRIAKYCSHLIADRDNIMLDCSTTSLFIAREIKSTRKSVTVITNSLDIMNELMSCDFVRTTGIGGTLRKTTGSFCGHAALEALGGYYADKAFISCSALHLSFGATDNHESEAHIRARMLANSQNKFFVVDNTKFDAVSANHIVALDGLDCIITDAPVSKPWQRALDKHSTRLIVAD